MQEYIKETFMSEFGHIADKYEIASFPVTEYNYKYAGAGNPGVYVFFMGDKVWRVGKHQEAVLDRAWTHFKADTGNKIGCGMKQYETCADMWLMLFVIREPQVIRYDVGYEGVHYILAIEDYLESRFLLQDKLVIRSGRRG